MEAADQKLYYKIGEACRVLDIQPYVLRYWETEFPILQPTKSRSGQRVYSERELGVIRRIKELLYDEGYTIAGAKKKLEIEGLAAVEDEATAVLAAPPAEDDRLSSSRKVRRRRPVAVSDEPSGTLLFPDTVKADGETEGGTETASATFEPEVRLRAGLVRILAEAKALLARLDSAS